MMKKLRFTLSYLMFGWAFDMMPASSIKDRACETLKDLVYDHDRANPLKLNPQGHCPVQIEGYIHDRFFYFRARWSAVSICVAKSELGALSFRHENFEFFRSTEYGQSGYDAGHMSHEDAIRIATYWLNEYLDIRYIKNPQNDELAEFIKKTRRLPIEA